MQVRERGKTVDTREREERPSTGLTTKWRGDRREDNWQETGRTTTGRRKER